ncbi:MAG: phosphatase PAP2 family protein, partial [Anaerolineae bacterium]|nr:phosphatase PAP2 family protein [Anaerolineae bacterium]
EMDELRAFERDPRTDAIVRFWEYGAGGRHAYLYHWNVMQKLMFEFGVEDNPPLATSIYSSVSVSQYDAYIATWDAKYFYLRIRPFQYDPEFTTVIPTPNHPSYPSAHSVSSMAVYAALAQWFPSRSDDLMNIVSIISESRFWGGIHYRSDMAVGEVMGLQIASKVMEPFESSRMSIAYKHSDSSPVDMWPDTDCMNPRVYLCVLE